MSETNILKTECEEVEYIDFSINAEHFSNSFHQSTNQPTEFDSTVHRSLLTNCNKNVITSLPNKSLSLSFKPCSLCNQEFDSERRLDAHVAQTHPSALKCRKCFQWCENYAALNRHHLESHVSLYTCQRCGRTFKDRTVWHNHVVLRHRCDQTNRFGKVETEGDVKRNNAARKSTNQSVSSQSNNNAAVLPSSDKPPALHFPPNPTAPHCNTMPDSNSNNLVFYVILPPAINSAPNSVQFANTQTVISNGGILPASTVQSNNLLFKSGDVVSETISTMKKKGNIDDNESVTSGYYCVNCKIKFMSQDLYDVHNMQTHFNSSTHKCDLCNKSFKRRGFDYYLNHNCFRSKRPNICPICRKSFPTISTMQQHMTTHDQSDHAINSDKAKSYECSKCNCMFTGYMTMWRHIKTCKVSIFTCSLCRIFFRKESKLQLHNRLYHCSVNTYICYYCSEKLSSKLCLQRHYQSVHNNPENAHRCPTCLKFFRLRPNLDCHIRTVHSDRPYKCDLCSAMLTTITHVKSHFTKRHKTCELYYSVNKVSSKTNYKQIIKRPSVNISEFNLKSESTETATNGVSNSAVQSLAATEPQIVCSYSIFNKQNRFGCHLCPQTFQFKHRLKYHILNVHNSSRPIKCNSCSRCFKTGSGFRAHKCSGSSRKFMVLN